MIMKFLISEEEKSRILNMHQNASSRQYLSEQAIYNWEGDGRKIKYKVQGNKYYTSRDDGKTWTELTKQQDIDWVKTNAIKPENLDKSAKTATAPGPAVTVGQKFVVTDASGNQLLWYRKPYNTDTPWENVGLRPVNAEIRTINFGTEYNKDYVNMSINVGVAGQVGVVNYLVYCVGGRTAKVGTDVSLKGEDLMIMRNKLSPNVKIGNYDSQAAANLFVAFRDYGLNQMNPELATSSVSYFCDGGKLRSGWKAKINQ